MGIKVNNHWQSERSYTKPRLLVVIAHPGDEVLLAGGTLARYALGGVETALLCLTHDENGHNGELSEDECYLLPRVRKAELARSSGILGVYLLSVLDFPDGKLAETGTPRPAAYIANIIRRFQPNLVLTYGPDGLTGHPDHKALYKATNRASQIAAEPGAGLFYGGLKEESVKSLGTKLESTLDEQFLKLTPAPYIELDTAISVYQTSPIKWAALGSHRSQAATYAELTPADFQLLSRHEYFRLVQVAGAYAVRPARLAGPAATDLFARVEQSIPLLATA